MVGGRYPSVRNTSRDLRKTSDFRFRAAPSLALQPSVTGISRHPESHSTKTIFARRGIAERRQLQVLRCILRPWVQQRGHMIFTAASGDVLGVSCEKARVLFAMIPCFGRACEAQTPRNDYYFYLAVSWTCTDGLLRPKVHVEGGEGLAGDLLWDCHFL